MISENKAEILLKMLKAHKMFPSDVINFLKNNEVDLDQPDSHGYNLFHYAIRKENTEVIHTMLNLPEESPTKKADPNTYTTDDQNKIHLPPTLYALQICSDSELSYKAVRNIIKAGGDINLKDENDCTILHRASEKGRIDILNMLFDLDPSPDINLMSKHGSAMHLAIIGDQDDTIALLLDKKIDLSLKDSNGNTPLHLALQLKMSNAFKQIADYLIKTDDITNQKKKEIFNATNSEGNTILHELAYAKMSVLTEFVKKFKSDYKVEEDTKNAQGYTYKEVGDNIVRLAKEREENEKLTRELIRKDKERLAEERRKEVEFEKQLREQVIQAEEKKRQLGLKFLKYRGLIFGGIAIIFLLVLFFAINNASKKKKHEIVL